jgi:ABC-type uncharacterized transport system involved in gliding motility auxiliary subunit
MNLITLVLIALSTIIIIDAQKLKAEKKSKVPKENKAIKKTKKPAVAKGAKEGKGKGKDGKGKKAPSAVLTPAPTNCDSSYMACTTDSDVRII